MRILVSKYGGLFCTREAAAKNSSSGEQGETEGLIRHLTKEHDVLYFGRYEGKPLCQVVEPNIKGFRETTTWEQQCEGFRQDIAAVEAFQPQAYVMSAGYSVTMSMIQNPNSTTVQAASIRYTAPILNLLTHFELPRIVVNNDPRTYPKDQEMSLGWPYARPVALLDQGWGDVNCVVGGGRYIRRSVYAKAESWAHHLRRPNTREFPAVCIAHAHIHDGCKQKDRVGPWHNVLDGNDIWVYGKGWEGFGCNWQGCLDPAQVMDLLNRCDCCPCVAQKQFYTGKVYVCEAQGCVPLLYGDGSDPYTWDPLQQFLPFDSPWRIRKPGDLARIVDMTRAQYDDMIGWWGDMCQPDWTKLDDMLSELETTDWRTRKWWERWGGYWAL
jgi:hypothetical protein